MSEPKTIPEIIEEKRRFEAENAHLKHVIKVLGGEVSKWKTTARKDGLTGLIRREAFEDISKTLIERSQRNGNPVSYVLVDIDYFKRVNDVHGHPAGDKVLIEVGGLMYQEARRPMDLAGRIGGGELALFLSNTYHEGAVVVAERLRTAIEEHFKERIISVTVSAGVSTYVPGQDEVSGLGVYGDLYHAADGRLYRAKETGRNRIVGENE